MEAGPRGQPGHVASRDLEMGDAGGPSESSGGHGSGSDLPVMPGPEISGLCHRVDLRIMQLLKFIGYECEEEAVCVETDNKGAHDLCHRFSSAQHTRHIDRKLFKLREMRGAGLVKVKWRCVLPQFSPGIIQLWPDSAQITLDSTQPVVCHVSEITSK